MRPTTTRAPRAALRRRTTAALVVAAAGTALAACGSSSSGTPSSTSTAGASDVTLTLYNGQHEQTTQELADAFTKATGIKVKIRSDDEDVLAQQIEAEGSRTAGDVFFTENSPPLVRLDDKGLLAHLATATTSPIPAADSATTGDWVGVTARVNEVVYNTDELTAADLPKTLLDLADPKWKGKLEISPGETDFAPLVTAIASEKGDAAASAWLKGLKSNAGDKVAPDNETLVADIDKGTAAIGVINHYYWYRLQREVGAGKVHSALAPFAPQDLGNLLDVSGAAALKNSKHPAEAAQLVAFLTSKAGQSVIQQGDSFEYPLVAGVPANGQLPPFSSYHLSSLTLATVGDGTHAVQLLQDAGLL